MINARDKRGASGVFLDHRNRSSNVLTKVHDPSVSHSMFVRVCVRACVRVCVCVCMMGVFVCVCFLH